jgi:hypothetical protein
VIDYLQSSMTSEADGQAHGFGGCNDFTGRYTLEEAALTRATIRQMCPAGTGQALPVRIGTTSLSMSVRCPTALPSGP